MADNTTTSDGGTIETAGAFDIRTFIGALLGLFGLAVLLMGIFGFTAAESAKTGGVNANLWAGIGMLAAAVFFIAWARVKPITIVVHDNAPGAEEAKDIAPLD